MLALIPLRVWCFVGLGLAAAISIGVAIKHFEDVGAQKARAKIQQQAETDRAEGIAGARDARDCGSDRLWSVARGTCVDP